MKFIKYFQNVHAQTSNTYAINGVNIIEIQSNSGNTTYLLHVQNHDFRSNELLDEIYLCSCKECCAVSFYSICFSTLKPCNYWTSQTVDSIIRAFYQKYYSGKYIFISDLPKKLDKCLCVNNLIKI